MQSMAGLSRLQQDTVLVNRSCWRADAGDAWAARRQAEQGLSLLGPSAAGLPARALLLVRRLQVQVTAESSLRVATEQAFTAAGRDARRPFVQPDRAATAQAVWFADTEELLACLVRDLLTQRHAVHWWWRLLDRGDPQAFMRQELLPRGDRLLGVAARLAGITGPSATAGGWVAAWCAGLDESDATRALVALQQAHALVDRDPGPGAATATQGSAEPLTRPGPGASTPTATDRHLSAPTPVERCAATVARWVPEWQTSTVMRPAGRRLMATLLLLLRAPSVARSGVLPQAWAQLESQVERLKDMPANLVPASRPRHHHRATAPGIGKADFQRPAEPLAPAQARPILPGLRVVTPRRPEATSEQVAWASLRHQHQDDATRPAPPPRFASPLTGREFEATAQTSLQTSFGGLFYLLNAALALQLWPDFTAPRQAGLALSPWDWLARLGRDWFGAEFEGDAVWALLAELSGRRPGQLPGRDFSPPSDWLLAAEWLAPWGGAGSLRRRSTGLRIRQLHPAGFAVSDVARDPARGPGRARVRWWRHMRAYLDARLVLALGCDDAGEAAPLLCRHPARLSLSASGLQVHLALAGLPLAIRFAGLDRNPGWIPAAGRSISFHFE